MSFTKMNDQDEMNRVLHGQTADGSLPDRGQRDAGSASPVLVSEHPPQTISRSYQEQIGEWLRKSQESKRNTEQQEPAGENAVVTPLEKDTASEVRLQIPPLGGHAPNRGSFVSGVATAFRASFSNSKGDVFNRASTTDSEASRPPRGKEAWRRVQNIIRTGTQGTKERPHAQLETPAVVRVRGKQLNKPLREVVRQREIVSPKENMDEDAQAIRARPTWGTDHTQGREAFDRVEAIVSRASSYAGPKTVKSEEEGTMLYWLTMTTPYLKVAGFVVLATFDLILALVFHIFWSTDDFMCTYETQRRGEPELVVMALLATVACGHFIRQVSKLLRTDGGGEWIGLRYFYSRELFGYYGLWVNNADFYLNAASATVLGLHALDCSDQKSRSLYHVIVRRVHGHVHLIRSLFAFQRCFSMNEYLRQQLQIAVSVNKRRFISADTKTNLDLTYICDRLIAMAIPCVDYVMYRNDIRDVARFFAAFHYGTFLVFNLCEGHEEGGNGNYDASMLYNQVQHVTFHDHNVPRFRCIVKFCETAADWLSSGDKNVVAVHCQGGKGRTGSFCSSLQLYTGFCDTAKEALDKFALRRTQRMRYGESLQGVSSPSQIRYVHYLEAYIYQGVDYHQCKHVILHRVSLANMKPAAMKGSSLTFVVEVDGVVHYDHGKDHGFLGWDACDSFVFDIGDVIVAGDVTVRFFLFDDAEALAFASHNRDLRGALGEGARTIKYGSLTGKQMLFASVHTAFHQGSISLMKNEVDGAYHMPESKYGDDFSMTMHIRQPSESAVEASMGVPPIAGNNGPSSPPLHGLSLDEFMPRKINPALQFLSTRQRVQELFEKMCPKPTGLNRGDRIIEHRGGYMTLHYIVRGHLTTRAPVSGAASMQSIKAVFASENRGAGDILIRGMDQVLASASQDYYSGCRHTSIRVLELPLSPDGFMPIEAPDMDQTELAALYTYLAHQAVGMCRKYRDKINSHNHMNATKRSTQLLENRGTKKVLNEINRKFGVDKTETFLCGSSAEQEVSIGGYEAGQAYVVSNWVLFSTERSLWHPTSRREVIVRIYDITSADSNGDTLHVQIDSARGSGGEEGSNRRRASCESSGLEQSKFAELLRGGRQAPKKGGRRMELMQKRQVKGDVALRLPDEETCEVFRKAINERMREMQSNRKSGRHSWDVRHLKFGYILPAEQDDEAGKAFLQHLLNISEVRVYAPGEDIIGPQNSQRSLYHIISGNALRYSSSSHMEDVGPGEMVGEWRFLAYNSGFAETAQVVASTEVKCFVTPFEQVQTICSLRKEFAVRFYRGLALCCVIRARQFKRMYLQNLQSDEEEEVVMSRYRDKQRAAPPRMSRASNMFQSTANLFANAPTGSKADGGSLSQVSALRQTRTPPSSVKAWSPGPLRGGRLGRRNSLGSPITKQN